MQNNNINITKQKKKCYNAVTFGCAAKFLVCDNLKYFLRILHGIIMFLKFQLFESHKIMPLEV
jgi:hypothetical protein